SVFNNSGNVHLIIDVQGYYSDASTSFGSGLLDVLSPLVAAAPVAAAVLTAPADAVAGVAQIVSGVAEALSDEGEEGSGLTPDQLLVPPDGGGEPSVPPGDIVIPPEEPLPPPSESTGEEGVAGKVVRGVASLADRTVTGLVEKLKGAAGK
ncbi:MAG: hypothetical protein ACRDIA_01540, partial [Actinomycetota bacterium]